MQHIKLAVERDLVIDLAPSRSALPAISKDGPAQRNWRSQPQCPYKFVSPCEAKTFDRRIEALWHFQKTVPQRFSPAQQEKIMDLFAPDLAPDWGIDDNIQD